MNLPFGGGVYRVGTRFNLQAGDTFAQGRSRKLDGFGCDQGWAYAYATLTAPSGDAIDVTDVLASRNGQWVTQDRSQVCVKGKMPNDIYNAGCTSN